MTNEVKNYSDLLVWEKPAACAFLSGDKEHEDLRGTVLFYPVPGGVLMRVEIFGLPIGESPWGSQFFGFHIHEGESCTGNGKDPFSNTEGHYNPTHGEHPSHAGDLPPVLGNNSYAWSAFVTNRFDVEEIIGKTIVLHSHPDDFKTQPSGDSGKRIACGKINRVR